MASYPQATIHSKIAKLDKVSGGQQPKIYRGTLRKFGKINKSQSKINERQLMKEVEILPKTKINIERKMKNKVIPSLNKRDQIILMQSSVFPAIYFKKTTMRNVLKQFNFPQNVKALSPNDDRMPLIFQIVSNLFHEITFFLFNILIGQNVLSQSYYIFFSDSQTIPFTKCCNAPVYIQLIDNGSGKILCNSLKCPHSNLAQFLINFEDGRKLWKNITYFAEASQKDKQLKNRISRLINNGKYRKIHLATVVEDTSKEIVDLFYQSKGKNNPIESIQPIQSQTPFITANQIVRNKQQDIQQQNKQIAFTAQDILSPQENNNIQLLKMKIQYMTQNTGNQISKRLTKNLVNEGKVFHKNFEMIKKIDEFMLGQKRSKYSTQISFPKIMDQMKKIKNKTSKSNSMYEVVQ